MRKRIDWESHINEWRGSGKSQSRYCREAQISLSSFQYQKSALERCQVSQDFVEVGGTGSIEFVVGEKLIVRVPLDTSPSRLSELAKCLS